MIRLEGETLPLESRGAVPPILFGDVCRDVPGIPVQVGWAATLADNCGIDASVLTLKLGGTDLVELLAAVPASGVVQLENEWAAYSAIVGNPPRLILTARGYRETVPAAHAKGTAVYFVETRPLYVFAYVPPGCSYPPDALVQLRVNDNAETPPVTVRLADDRLVPGERFVTAEFDASKAFYTPPPPTLPSSVFVSAAGGPAGGSGLNGRVAVAGGRMPLRSYTAQAQSGGVGRVPGATGGLVALGHSNVKMKVLLPPAAPMMRPPSREPLTGPASAGTLSLRQGVLGRVTADLRGVRDTVGGRYSGVGLAPLITPTAIVRLILEETYGETALHEPTWTRTAARLAQRGITWRLAWRGDDFERFRDAAQACGQADLYLDDAGRWRYAFRDPIQPAVGTITPRELLGDPALAWTPGRDVITELEIAWGAGPTGGTVTLDSPPMIPRHGRNHGGVSLPYAATEAVARTLGRYALSRRDRPRQSLTLMASHAWLGLTVADRIFVDTALLRLYGAKRVPYEIVGVTDRGDERVLALLEADPLAVEIMLSGSLVASGMLTLTLSGSLDVAGPMAVPLTGTVVLARSLSRPLAGTLVVGRTVTLTLAGSLATPGAGLVTLGLTGTLIRHATPLALTLAGTLDTAAAPVDTYRHTEPGTRIDF